MSASYSRGARSECRWSGAVCAISYNKYPQAAIKCHINRQAAAEPRTGSTAVGLTRFTSISGKEGSSWSWRYGLHYGIYGNFWKLCKVFPSCHWYIFVFEDRTSPLLQQVLWLDLYVPAAMWVHRKHIWNTEETIPCSCPCFTMLYTALLSLSALFFACSLHDTTCISSAQIYVVVNILWYLYLCV